MRTICGQCEHFGTKGCKEVLPNDGACAAFEEKEEDEG
jgi:hypothetical protein